MDIEKLAKIQHEIWSHWMRFLFKCCKEIPGGNMIISAEKVQRWIRLLNTPYDKLTEEEKESDREIVREFMLSNECPTTKDKQNGETE
jgi:hypothetical protein